MKFHSAILATAVALGISGFGMGTSNVQASTDLNQQQLVETYASNFNIQLPTFYSNYTLPFYRPGLTYSTNTSAIYVSPNGRLSTTTPTTAKIYAYYNGVLDHTFTVYVQ